MVFSKAYGLFQRAERAGDKSVQKVLGIRWFMKI